MARPESRIGDPTRERHGRGSRLYLLGGLLLALSVGYVLRDSFSDHPGPNRGRSHTREEIAEYEARVLPSKDDILRYLDGEAVLPTDARGVAGRDVAPLTLRREAMEDVTIKREGHFFTTVTFKLEAGERPYAVQILINHNPVDGTFAFDGFRVQKASRP